MDVLYRELSRSEGERKVEILLEMGDVAAGKLGDSEYAAKSYLLALSERPNDRAILTKLMQLYGAEKDWPQLIQVITRLADVVEEPKHKAKYLHTASMIASRELSDLELASKLLGQALEHDPDRAPAIDEALSMYTAAEELRRREARAQATHRQRAARRRQTSACLESLAELAEVYQRFLGRRDQAVAVYESALEVDPGSTRFQEKLARLYGDDPVSYFEKAVETLGNWIERDAYQPAPVQAACARCTPRRATRTPPGAPAKRCTCSVRRSPTKSASSTACAARNQRK